MTGKIELTDKAERLLMGAKTSGVGADGKPLWLINRTLGYKTWESGGKTGARPDIAELYRHGLIAEWFNPWGPPVFLTRAGKEQKDLRESLGVAA